jgi:hypothetical protein
MLQLLVVYQVLNNCFGMLKRKQFWRRGYKQDKINIDFKETGYGNVDWIELAQDRD